MSTPHRQPPALCFDRTPLLIGIVMIPLAASCLVLSGGLFLRSAIGAERQAGQQEQRIVLSERDRREEAEQAARSDEGEQEVSRRTLHSAPPHAMAAASPRVPRALITRAVPVSPKISPLCDAERPSLPNRGPPDARA